VSLAGRRTGTPVPDRAEIVCALDCQEGLGDLRGLGNIFRYERPGFDIPDQPVGEAFRRSDPVIDNDRQVRGMDPVNMDQRGNIFTIAGVFFLKNAL
jgi:hypothetical protein